MLDAPVAAVLKQDLTPGRTTLLDGVNTMLRSIGEAPVENLADQTVAEALNARDTLLEFHKEGQTRGWHWNSDNDCAFAVNQDGELVLPANVVRWIPDPHLWAGRLKQRGTRIWDSHRQTYKLRPPIEVVYADVVWLLDWDSSPEQYNRWTITRAARVFGARTLGNDSLVSFTLKDEQDAYAELVRMETENAAYNVLTPGPLARPLRTFWPSRGLIRHGGGGFPVG